MRPRVSRVRGFPSLECFGTPLRYRLPAVRPLGAVDGGVALVA